MQDDAAWGQVMTQLEELRARIVRLEDIRPECPSCGQPRWKHLTHYYCRNPECPRDADTIAKDAGDGLPPEGV